MTQPYTEPEVNIVFGGKYLTHGAFVPVAQSIGEEDTMLALRAMVWQAPKAANEE